MRAELSLSFSQPLQQFVQFLGTFLAVGAIGFRYSALRGRMIQTDHTFFHEAARRAAIIGLVGLLITIVLAATGLPGQAAKAKMSTSQFLTSDFSTALRFGMLALALIGLLLATARKNIGWLLALIGIFVGTFRNALSGQWGRLAGPTHVFAAGLWLGTLFVLVTAGLSALLKHEPTRSRRGAMAAEMVNSFSPLAVTMGMVVVLLGLVLTWQNLPTLDSLWTTTYGVVLIIKLVFVACVFGLGAWNWRRQRPLLGSEQGAIAIRRSATTELAFATIVLIVTAILVSVPSPNG